MFILSSHVKVMKNVYLFESILIIQIEGQTRGSIGMRAISNIIRRPWLISLLPSKVALLRAPLVKHVILEDWLMTQQVE